MLTSFLVSVLTMSPPAFEQYCFDCHGDGMSKGELALDEVLTARSVEDADAWLALRARLRSGDMPPEGEDRPSDEDYRQMRVWVNERIESLARTAAAPGRVGPRRLNNVEYERTIHDLFGVELDVMERFPPMESGRDSTQPPLFFRCLHCCLRSTSMPQRRWLAGPFATSRTPGGRKFVSKPVTWKFVER